MKYAVIKVINGNYSVHAEGFTDANKAKVNYHSLCQVLWNAEDVITGCVAIVDENLDIANGYKEFISHPVPMPEPEPEPEPEINEEETPTED